MIKCMAFDFIIVGAGTCGSYCAWKLAEKGYKVLCVDNRAGPGSVIRSTGAQADYWFEQAGIKDLIPDRVKASTIWGFRVISPNNDYYQFRMKDKPIGYVLYQHLFEEWLAEQAVKAGAQFMWQTKATNIVVVPGQIWITLQTTSGTFDINCRKLVIADGPNSTIGQKAGLAKKIPVEDMHQGMEYCFPNKYDYAKDEFWIYFSRRYAPNGYLWHFPEGKFAKIGNGVPLSIGNPRRYLMNYITDHKMEVDMPSIDHEVGGLIPTARPYKKIISDDGRIAIAGDAARMVLAVTGGGIHTALLSAYKIAEFAEDLKQYQKWYHKSGLYKLLLNAYRVKRILYRFRNGDFNDMVKAMKSIPDNIVEGYMSKKPQSAMFKFMIVTMLKNPHLILKALPGYFV